METEVKNKRTYIPFEVKKQAVADIEAGVETLKSLSVKFNVAVASVKNWREQIRYGVSGFEGRVRIDQANKRKAVREIKLGVLTEEAAVVKYGVRNKSTIREWLKQFSHEISDTIPTTMSTSEKEQSVPASVQLRCNELERALSQAHVKIAGLETLIDVAEKELHIDIRKKSGTKQS